MIWFLKGIERISYNDRHLDLSQITCKKKTIDGASNINLSYVYPNGNICQKTC